MKKKKKRSSYSKEDLSEQRSILEERFEKLLQEYDNEESDEEEEEKPLNPELENTLNEFLAETVQNKHKDGISEDTRKIIQSIPDKRKDIDKEFEYLEIQEEPEFDCESITSTYSNIYNHPKLIEEPSNNSKKKSNCQIKQAFPLEYCQRKKGN